MALLKSFPENPLRREHIEIFYDCILEGLVVDKYSKQISISAEMISKDYLSFLKDISVSSGAKSTYNRTVAQIKLLNDIGFFLPKLTQATVELIIKDIKENGRTLKTILKVDDDDNEFEELLGKLEGKRNDLSILSGSSTPSSPVMFQAGRQHHRSELEMLSDYFSRNQNKNDLSEQYGLRRRFANLCFEDGKRLFDEGFLSQAIIRFQDAIASIREIDPNRQLQSDHETLILCQQNLANAFNTFCYENIEALQEQTDDIDQEAIQNIIENYEAAISTLNEITNKSVEDFTNIALSLENLAVVYKVMEDWANVILNLEKAIQTVSAVSKPNDEAHLRLIHELIEAYGQFGANKLNKGDSKSAASIFEQAINLFESVLFPEEKLFDNNMLKIYSNLITIKCSYARSSCEDEDYHQAFDLFKQALNLANRFPELHKIKREVTVKYANALYKLGASQCRREGLDKGIVSLKMAIALLEEFQDPKTKNQPEVLSKSRSKLAQAFNKKGKKYIKSGKAQKAQEILQEALDMINQNDPPSQEDKKYKSSIEANLLLAKKLNKPKNAAFFGEAKATEASTNTDIRTLKKG